MIAEPLTPRYISGAILAAMLATGCGPEPTAQVDASAVRSASDATTSVLPAKPDPYARGTAETEVFLTTGTIQSVDEGSDRITISHDGSPSGEIAAGTNEFIAQDGDQLSLVKPGQKIEFSFLRDVEGHLVLTAISPMPPAQ